MEKNAATWGVRYEVRIVHTLPSRPSGRLTTAPAAPAPGSEPKRAAVEPSAEPIPANFASIDDGACTRDNSSLARCRVVPGWRMLPEGRRDFAELFGARRVQSSTTRRVEDICTTEQFLSRRCSLLAGRHHLRRRLRHRRRRLQSWSRRRPRLYRRSPRRRSIRRSGPGSSRTG